MISGSLSETGSTEGFPFAVIVLVRGGEAEAHLEVYISYAEGGLSDRETLFLKY